METIDVLTITLPEELQYRVVKEASYLGVTPTERVLQVLGETIGHNENVLVENTAEGLVQLANFLRRVPSIKRVSFSPLTEQKWWIKLKLDITSPVAWYVVQSLGYVLNSLSIDEPLPTVFRPVSAPPYMNGGPTDYLAWLIEAQTPFLDAGIIASFLEERLPQPVEEEAKWLEVDEDDEE